MITPTPVTPGSVIRARPVGALLMEDEKGIGEKFIAVPVDELPYWRVSGFIAVFSRRSLVRLVRIFPATTRWSPENG